MLFPLAAIGDLQFRLLLIQPDFQPDEGRPIEISHRFDTRIGESRTSIEERRPGRRALLLTQTCTLFLRTAAMADDWRKGLAALGSRLVGVPLWIDALPPAQWAERVYDARKIVGFDPESGAFAIYDGPGLPGVVSFPLYAPLLLGRWKERPPAEAATEEIGFVRVTIAEASPWACRIRPQAQAGGWTAVPDHTGPIQDSSDYGLETIELGAAREPALDRVNAAPRWRQEGDFTFPDRLSIRQALTHFEAVQGALYAWTPVPAWFQPGADTPATPDHYTARFASDTLALSWLAGHVARAKIGFVQEVETPSRPQALPGEFHLYQLQYQHDTGSPELFTDCDEPLVAPEGTYQPRQVAHQEIRRSLKPQDDKATLRLAFAAGSLADDWLRGRLFGWVLLTIWKCDPADPAGTRGSPLYTGFVVSVAPAGNTLTIEATLFGRLLKERAPAAVFGPQCSTFVFSSRCGLLEGDHDSTGTAASGDLSADGKTLTVHGVSGWGGSVYADNWFAQGLLRTGAGRMRIVVTILGSTTSAGNLVLKLARPLPADLLAGDAGQAVQLLPGCGRQYESDCGDKFGNQENFRGEPFMPAFIEQRDPGAPKTPKK
ncbi:MAG: phage BR0599 family protein [Verrucomicrobia bacterium]|nr:phage BR0599 family protein [Verrucomicrobiota bacterium]